MKTLIKVTSDVPLDDVLDGIQGLTMGVKAKLIMKIIAEDPDELELMAVLEKKMRSRLYLILE